MAQQLTPDKGIRYIGTDVIPRLIESAKKLTMRQNWEFSVVEDVRIPCADNAADLSHSSPFSHIRRRKKASKTFKRPHGVQKWAASSHLVSGVPDPMSLGNFHAIS